MSDPFGELCQRLADEQRRQKARRFSPAPQRHQLAATQPSRKIDMRAMRATLTKAERTLDAAALQAVGGFTIGQGVRVRGVDGGFQVLGPWSGDRMLLRKVTGGIDPQAAFANEESNQYLADRADLTHAPEFDAPAGYVATAIETLKIAGAVADVRAAKDRLRARLAAAHAQVQRDVEARRINAIEAAKRVTELNNQARKLGL